MASRSTSARLRHITLWPDSDRSGFEPIVIDMFDADEDCAVVAEMLMVVIGGDAWQGRTIQLGPATLAVQGIGAGRISRIDLGLAT